MSRFSQQTQGILWMIVTGFLNVGIYVVMHYIGQRFGFHAFQVFFFYCLTGAAFYLPIGLRTIQAVDRKAVKYYALRPFLEFTAFTLMLSALDLLPLPMQTALGFTAPIFGSLMAVILLGERNSIHRWISLLMGFIGVLVIQTPSLRQGESSLNRGALYVLLASLGFSLAGICIKKMTRTEPPQRIAFYMLVSTAIFSLPFAIWKWQPVPLAAFPFILGLGFAVAIVQFAVGQAYSKADVTLILPFSFLNLLWSGSFAYLVFGEVINRWTVIGAAIIMAGAIYGITHNARANMAATLRASSGS